MSLFLYYLSNIDSTSKVVVRYEYDAWGNHSIIGDEVLGNLNPFRYRSYYYDVETKLYYLQTRYYDPELCRFTNIDGIEYIDAETINGLNLYAYCGNNPVMRVDPTGTWDWGKFWEGLGLLITSVAAIVVSVATFGAGTPLIMAVVAGVTLGAGILTGINGIATIVEAGTNYNFVRDGIFQGNSTAYDWYSGITEGIAVLGTAILGMYNMSGRAKAARYGRKFLGKGYQKISKKRWVSSDGLRQMIFDDTHHILDGVKTTNHFNLYNHASNLLEGKSKIIKKLHLFYTLFKYRLG